MKIFLLLSLTLSIIFGLKVYKKYEKNPVNITPYPFHIVEDYKKQIPIVERASVVIVGDQMGHNLNTYLPSLIKDISSNLAEVIKVFNWSRKNEGMHRTLSKIKSLKNLPEIIIYHGGSEEFFEKTFFIKDKETILANFKKHSDEKILSLIMAFPTLSKFIYEPVTTIELDQWNKDNDELEGQDKLSKMEMTYKFFRYQLWDMVNYIKEKNSTLILLTTPINLKIPPKKVCKGTTNALLNLELDKIEKEIKNEKFNIAFQKLELLKKKVLGNSKVLYFSGISTEKLGFPKTAEKILQKSAVFDCGTWRGNKIFNNIIREASTKHDLFLIDFDKIVNSQFGKGPLFIGDTYPQTFFYKKVLEEIKQIINQTLEI